MAEGLRKVRITICAGCSFKGKVQLCTDAIKQGLALDDSQILIERGPGKSIKVEVEDNGDFTVLIDRSGKGFFTEQTPANIVEALRPYYA